MRAQERSENALKIVNDVRSHAEEIFLLLSGIICIMLKCLYKCLINLVSRRIIFLEFEENRGKPFEELADELKRIPSTKSQIELANRRSAKAEELSDKIEEIAKSALEVAENAKKEAETFAEVCMYLDLSFNSKRGIWINFAGNPNLVFFSAFSKKLYDFSAI